MIGNQKIVKFLDIFSYIFLLVNIVAIPLFLDKQLVNFYTIPKQYLFICLLLVNVILFVIKTILSKSLSYRYSSMDIPIIIVLVVALFSVIFSINGQDSFLGRTEYFVFNYLYLIFLATFYFLIVNIINSRVRWSGIVDALVYTGGLTLFIFILKSVFKADVLGWFFPGISNMIDKVNTPFGIFTIIIFIIAAGSLLKKDLKIGKALAYFFVTILSFVVLVLLSFNILWWIMLGSIVLLLLIGVNFMKEVQLGWISALFSLLIFVIIFITFGTPRTLQVSVPSEISLGQKASWNVSSKTILSGTKNFIVGSGLGTFSVDFSKFRPSDFNNDRLAWSLRFSQPFNTVFALVSEGGVLLMIVLLFIILYTIGHVFNVWFKNINEIRSKHIDLNNINAIKLEVFIIVAAWLALTVSMFFVFFGVVLWWLWWLLLGISVVGLSFINSDIIKLKEFEVENTPQHSLTFSFIMIIFLAGLIMVGVFGARLYLAEVSYARALKSENYEDAEKYLNIALYERTNSDIYHVALAKVFLGKAVDLVNTEPSNIQGVSDYVAEAVKEARIATDISPNSVFLWENLAIMYENAASIVPEAREWAINSWQEAQKLEPTNVIIYWNLGNNYILSDNIDEAIIQYKKATELKQDYLDAYISLANIYEQQENLDDSIEMYKQAINQGAGQMPTVLFDFGRVLYNRDQESDRQDAELLWLGAVKLQPSFSNALYSLGLLYESENDKTTALEYYYKVKELNPDNKDISKKIKSLIVVSTVNPEEDNE